MKNDMIRKNKDHISVPFTKMRSGFFRNLRLETSLNINVKDCLVF